MTEMTKKRTSTRNRRLWSDALNDGWAADEDATDDLTGQINAVAEFNTAISTTWIILCGVLVFFMNAGFALLESGACRAVSCQSVFLKNLLDACFGTMLWFFVGFAFMYGSVGDSTPFGFIG